jgi:NTP pyrophosphatase (non-canonical NTP hydrolase)
MPDNTTTLAVLKEAVRRFAAERAWEPFHTPKNLSMGVAVEAAELMEQFLWVEGEASRAVVRDPARLTAVAEEMADVACHLLNLSNTLGIDLSEAILSKIGKNALKYPVEEYRGRSGMEAGTTRRDRPAAGAKSARRKKTSGQRKGER